MEEENKTIQTIEQKPLSKREMKKLAKQEKKQRKKEQKLADKEFEKNHPLRKRKIAAWIITLVGLLVVCVPGVLFIGAAFLALLAALLGIFLYIILIFGLICFGLGWFIFYATTGKSDINDYFGIAGGIFDWINGLGKFIDSINGYFITIFAGVSVVLEIVGFVLLMTSLSACTKKHKIAYIILMALIMTVSIGLLAYGLLKIF